MWKWLISLFKKEEGFKLNTELLKEDEPKRTSYLTQEDLNECERKVREVGFEVNKHLTMREIWEEYHKEIFDELNKLRMVNFLEPIVIGPIVESSISDSLRNGDFLLNVLGRTNEEKSRLMKIKPDELLEISSLDFESIYAYKLIGPKTVSEMSELFTEREDWRTKRAMFYNLPPSARDLYLTDKDNGHKERPVVKIPRYIEFLMVMYADDVERLKTLSEELDSWDDKVYFDTAARTIAGDGSHQSEVRLKPLVDKPGLFMAEVTLDDPELNDEDARKAKERVKEILEKNRKSAASVKKPIPSAVPTGQESLYYNPIDPLSANPLSPWFLPTLLSMDDNVTKTEDTSIKPVTETKSSYESRDYGSSSKSSDNSGSSYGGDSSGNYGGGGTDYSGGGDTGSSGGGSWD